MTTCPFNPEQDGAETAFDGRMSYGDYLQIDKILTAQTLMTGAQFSMGDMSYEQQRAVMAAIGTGAQNWTVIWSAAGGF